MSGVKKKMSATGSENQSLAEQLASHESLVLDVKDEVREDSRRTVGESVGRSICYRPTQDLLLFADVAGRFFVVGGSSSSHVETRCRVGTCKVILSYCGQAGEKWTCEAIGPRGLSTAWTWSSQHSREEKVKIRSVL